MSQRENWIDAARGVGIVLVVAGHNTGLWANLPSVGRMIFSFHMPLFFVIAGLTLSASNLRSTLVRMAGLLISYFSLCILTLPLTFKRSDYESFGHVLLGIAYGTGHTIVIPPLWFLPCLALAQLAVFVVDRLTARLGNLNSAAADAVKAVVLCVVGTALLPDRGSLLIKPSLDWGTYIGSGAWANVDLALLSAGFLYMGRSLKHCLQQSALSLKQSAWMAAGFTGGFVLLIILVDPVLDMNMRVQSPAYPAALVAALGSGACLMLIYALRTTWFAVLAAYVGFQTLLILALHGGIQKRAWDALSPQLAWPLATVLALGAGLLIPLLIDRALLRFPRLRLLVYPQPILAVFRERKNREPSGP